MLPIQLQSVQLGKFERNGFLIVPDLVTQKEIETFLQHEEDPATQDLRQGLRTHLSDPYWHNLANHPNIAGIARQLLGGLPRIVQTMYLPKKPANPNQEMGDPGISLHQDSHYLPNEPDTLLACWIALNDTDSENGGLCVVPGSHKDNLRETTLNTDPEHVSWEVEYEMGSRNGNKWKEKLYSFGIVGIDKEDLLHLTVPSGGGVFFTSKTVHGSYANWSKSRPRLAFAVHYVKEGTWVFRTDVQETTPVNL